MSSAPMDDTRSTCPLEGHRRWAGAHWSGRQPEDAVSRGTYDAMKSSLAALVLGLFAAVDLFAQKPPLDTAALRTWPSLGRAAITHDGQYVLFTITNIPVESSMVVVQSTTNDWKSEIASVQTGVF